jgi:hypothetical protein
MIFDKEDIEEVGIKIFGNVPKKFMDIYNEILKIT